MAALGCSSGAASDAGAPITDLGVDVPSIDVPVPDVASVDVPTEATVDAGARDAAGADASAMDSGADVGVDAAIIDVGAGDATFTDLGMDLGSADALADGPVATDAGCPVGRATCAGVCCAAGQICGTSGCTPCPTGTAFVAGGSFVMGAADLDLRFTGMAPHPVTISAFCMDLTEVTASAYAACTAAGCAGVATGGTCNLGNAARASHPVNCVTWSQAQAYCAWSGGALPTEAQWEYAARGGSADADEPWGSAAPSDSLLCWNGGASMNAGTCPVRSYPAGAFGLFDLAGNVWEWTHDCYAPYVASTTPVGSACMNRVDRGGSWAETSATYVRAAIRGPNAPGYLDPRIGFRCVRGGGAPSWGHALARAIEPSNFLAEAKCASRTDPVPAHRAPGPREVRA